MVTLGAIFFFCMTDLAAGLTGGVISSDDVDVDEDVSDTTRMLPASSVIIDSGNNDDGIHNDGEPPSAEQDELRHATVSINNNNEEEEGDEVGRDNAVGDEAQNLLNMQNEIARPMSFLGFLRYV